MVQLKFKQDFGYSMDLKAKIEQIHFSILCYHFQLEEFPIAFINFIYH